MHQRKQNETFANYFQFFSSLERFCLLQATQEQNKTFLLKKWYQNETKTLQNATGFLKDRTKLLVVLQKFWKRTRTKAFEQNIYNTK
jgi:hypothetical protein